MSVSARSLSRGATFSSGATSLPCAPDVAGLSGTPNPKVSCAGRRRVELSSSITATFSDGRPAADGFPIKSGQPRFKFGADVRHQSGTRRPAFPQRPLASAAAPVGLLSLPRSRLVGRISGSRHEPRRMDGPDGFPLGAKARLAGRRTASLARDFQRARGLHAASVHAGAPPLRRHSSSSERLKWHLWPGASR